ncbi:45310_t:CDS:2 [Gigaspora margarita]|uniref:45310_t:CDS:1 n=1 Tax=Gigaspora margarita TaxID=4874 RepID=A0ABM8W3Q2_GIGMA|nr:45310_t:CDS:2 [Gigaspora margarita]
MSSIISKSFSQDKSNADSQIPESSIINSAKDSASDESISEYSYDKKSKKAKIKKSVGRPENPVNYKYIKLGVYNKNGHLNYVGQNLLESNFLQMMQNYTHLLISDAAIFEEDIQLYDSEDDFDDLNLEDNFENNPITNEVDSNILEIENSINLNLALNNTDQTLVLDEVIDHGKKDFDVDALVNQGMQMQNTSISKEN